MSVRDLTAVVTHIKALLDDPNTRQYSGILPKADGERMQLRADVLRLLFPAVNDVSTYAQTLNYWSEQGPTAFDYLWPHTEKAILEFHGNSLSAVRLLSRLIAWAAIEGVCRDNGVTAANETVVRVVAIELGLNPDLSASEVFGIAQVHGKLFQDLQLKRFEKTIKGGIEAVDRKKAEIEEKLNNWGSGLATSEAKVATLQGKISEYIVVLEKYKTELAFLGLAAAFKNFLDRKERESVNYRKWVYRLGIAVLVVPIFAAILVHFLIDGQDGLRMALTYFPFAAIELLVIYFFRIALMHYNSTQAQILQLELRMAATGFIQEYAKFAAENGKDEKADLSKFEALVFGGIVADLDKVPSTFDGIEALTGIVKELRGK